MNDIDKLLACSSSVARDLSAKFLIDIFATYHASGSEVAKEHVKQLNLASKAHEEYILELVTYWPHRLGQMFLIAASPYEWYIYRLGAGVYKCTATKEEKGYMIPPDAKRLMLGVLMAGHKCIIIGHPDFVIFKINL